MANTPTANIGLNKPAQGDAPWDVTMNGNMDKLDSLLSGGTAIPGLNIAGAKINGVTTVAGGVPALVAKADLTAQAANIGVTTLYAVPASGAGMYRLSAYLVITQAATVSSTMPQVQAIWTDNDSAAAAPASSFTLTNTTNTLGAGSASTVAAQNAGSIIINAKASTNIQFSTTGYASSGATPMQYAIHIKLEYLGS